MRPSPYQDQILDLLADGLERTVEEIRQGINAPDNARIHHVIAGLRSFLIVLAKACQITVIKFFDI